jgi:hypothetical protein
MDEESLTVANLWNRYCYLRFEMYIIDILQFDSGAEMSNQSDKKRLQDLMEQMEDLETQFLSNLNSNGYREIRSLQGIQ